ncbi:MAG: acetylglutamate kinase [Acidimicrobiaceae bacterium]|nr:acetylglutamate kinase [Acidimicrobiaceae bacterium]MCY4279263.1 acetylglutamate kinase [Acidimicrobiaceae bacterium]MCY4294667.1 acetylglutamate kinase [Acidimicrobiaceae bacterium]
MTGPSPAADSAAAAASDASHGFEPAGFETATTERLLASETAEASPDFEPQRRARALVEALPHIQRFSGSVVVVKYGGSAMTDPALAASFARDMVLVNAVGLRAVVVHGGGPQIGEQLARMGRQSEFRDGLRVTDAETLEVVRMVLVGKIGRDIVGAVGAGGGAAVGLSGEDAGLVKVVPRDPALGFVGDITAVDPTIIEQLLVEGTVPVVAPIGADTSGQAYNINADTMAAALAGALGAAKVVYLTDVAGLLADVSDASSLLGRATASDVEAMIVSGALSGGMIPKARACVDALSRGVGSAHILDGRIPHCVLLELFTDAGIGTMITRQDGPGPAHGQGTGQGASA